MPTVEQSTVWGQLAGINAAAGSLIFVGADSTTPTIDASNLYYDANGKNLIIGFASAPAYQKYGYGVGNGLVTEGMQDSYLSVADQTSVRFAGHSVSSSNGNDQVPVYSADGNLLGKFFGRAYSGLTTPAWNLHASIEMYAQGATVGDPGGQMLLKVKQDAGVLTTAMTIAQDLSVTIAGALTVIGALVFSGGVTAASFIPSVSVAIPAIGMYSDAANNLDFAINSAKVVTWTSATASFTQALSAVGLTSTGAVSLSPAALNVVISPTGAGVVTINPGTAGTLDNMAVGGTTPRAGAFTSLTASGAVTLSPANANVVLSPTGTGLVTINPATAGTLNNLAIGGTTPLAGTFTALTATGAVALSPANANVVISPTGTGLVTINPATAGTLNNLAIGGTTPLAGTFTALTATGAVALSPANANVVLSPTGTGVVTINPATAGTLNNLAIGGTTALAGTFTTLRSTSTASLGGAASQESLVVSAGPGANSNLVSILGRATGNAARIATTGVDANIQLNITTKGVANINIMNGTEGDFMAQFVGVAAARYFIFTPSTQNPSISVSSGNLVLGPGTGNTANAATTGYVMIPSVAGTPTGVPANNSAGQEALIFDVNANKIWIYNSTAAAWKQSAAMT